MFTRVFNNLYNYATSAIANTLNKQRYLDIQLDITNACNLRCTHCYHPDHRNSGAINFQSWKRILDQYNYLLNRLHLKPRILLCGGEPTLSTHFRPIIEEISSRWPDASITILSNGTLVNDELIAFLRKFNTRFQISLDGPDADRHDQIRGVGSFKKATLGIEKLVSNQFQVVVLTVLSKRSEVWISDFFQIAKKLNVSSMNFTRFIPQGTGKTLLEKNIDRPLTPFELKSALLKILAHSKLNDIQTNTNTPLYNLIDPNLGMNSQFGFQGLVVSYKGELKVSSRTNFILGNLLNESLYDLFIKHPLLESLRRGEIEVCGKCDHYTKCGGDRNFAYAMSGSFRSQDPGCWILPSSI